MGLYDMALIKDNHIDAAGGVAQAIQKVHQSFGDRIPIEVEVKNLEELDTALSLPVDRIMLDNMDLSTMREAVQITNGRVPLEASGNVNLETVRSIAETGVDYRNFRPFMTPDNNCFSQKIDVLPVVAG